MTLVLMDAAAIFLKCPERSDALRHHAVRATRLAGKNLVFAQLVVYGFPPWFWGLIVAPSSLIPRRG
jgi:hypothetical protein